MKILTLLFALLPLCAVAQKESPDELAIRAQVQRLQSGWNSASGKRFAEPFSERADYVVINGMHIIGREVIEKAHQEIFDTIYKGTTLQILVDKWRILRPEVATVIASAVLSKPDKTTTRARITFVFVKTDGKWMIESFQNTQIAQAPVENRGQSRP